MPAGATFADFRQQIRRACSSDFPNVFSETRFFFDKTFQAQKAVDYENYFSKNLALFQLSRPFLQASRNFLSLEKSQNEFV